MSQGLCGPARPRKTPVLLTWAAVACHGWAAFTGHTRFLTVAAGVGARAWLPPFPEGELPLLESWELGRGRPGLVQQRGLAVPLPVRTLPAAAVLGVPWAGQLFLWGLLRGGAGDRDCVNGRGIWRELLAPSFQPRLLLPLTPVPDVPAAPRAPGSGARGIHRVGCHVIAHLICHFTRKLTVGFLTLVTAERKRWKIRKRRRAKPKAGCTPATRKLSQLLPGPRPFQSSCLHGRVRAPLFRAR